jgi:hypothetical protein
VHARAQRGDPLAQLPVGGHHRAVPPGPPPPDHLDDRVVAGARRGHHPYRRDARHPAGGALHDEDDLDGRRQTRGSRHPGRRHAGQLVTQAGGRPGAVPPPAVRAGADHVGRIDHEQGRFGHAPSVPVIGAECAVDTRPAGPHANQITGEYTNVNAG